MVLDALCDSPSLLSTAIYLGSPSSRYLVFLLAPLPMSPEIVAPVTPPRKRFASEDYLGYRDVTTKPVGLTADTPSTPGLQDIPGLDWVDTPEAGDGSPRTPRETSPSRSPSINVCRKKPDRIIKHTRKSDITHKIKPSEPPPSAVIECASTDASKILVFPLHLYPSLPPVELDNSGLLKLVRGDIAPKNIGFLSPCKIPPTFSKPDDLDIDAVYRFPLHKLRSHLQKRLKAEDENSISGGSNLSLLSETYSAQQVSSNVKWVTGPGRPSLVRQAHFEVQHPVVTQLREDKSPSNATIKRYTRILPLNTIERLIENPGRCVASLVGDPGRRCSELTCSGAAAKSRTLDELSRLKKPASLPDLDDWIRGLVDSFTCSRWHYSVAIQQLEALFDLFHDRRSKTGKNKNSFIKRDSAFLQPWLEELTTLPEKKTNQTTKSIVQTSQVAVIVKQLDQDCGISNTKTFVTTQTTTVEQNQKGIKIATRNVRSANDKSYNSSQHARAFTGFISTQIVDISFTETSCQITSLAEERAKVSFVKSVNALEQEFLWFFPKLLQPAEYHIREAMNKDLGLREATVQGFIYMYWIPGSFDFVKIGVTSKKTSVRVAQWQKKCKHLTQEFTNCEVGKMAPLAHIYRVEKLIHTELREARLHEPACKAHEGGHVEWFAISPAHAQRVIDKWSNWMKTNPYEGGRLKDTSNMDRLCTPLPMSVRDTVAIRALQPVAPLEAPKQIASLWAHRLRPTKARQSRGASSRKQGVAQ